MAVITGRFYINLPYFLFRFFDFEHVSSSTGKGPTVRFECESSHKISQESVKCCVTSSRVVQDTMRDLALRLRETANVTLPFHVSRKIV